MGTFQSFRKAYGALKDSTMVGLAKVNNEYKDLDIAIVKATNHVELPPKERHLRKIFSATSVIRPRADVAYCIHALSKRLSKTRSWIVALKTLIVIHRTLREGDPTFREELLNYSHRGHVLQMPNFKDNSSPLAWDCSGWVRAYALFLEERLECFRALRYDIESECPPKSSPSSNKANTRTRVLNGEQLLRQLPALQQLLYRLTGCLPEGAAYRNHLIQYTLALVLKESFKVYCAVNDGIINLVDVFFDMPKRDAAMALQIYKRAGQQATNLAHLYDYCRGLDITRNFQFPVLRQPPASFLHTMEEYIKEAHQAGSVNTRLEYQKLQHLSDKEHVNYQESERAVGEKRKEMVNSKAKVEDPPLIPIEEDTVHKGVVTTEPNPKNLEESNALALAIIPNGLGNDASKDQSPPFGDLSGLDSSGWELALITTPSTTSNSDRIPEPKMGGGFDKLLLDSLYDDDLARKNIQLQNAGYGFGQACTMSAPKPVEQQQKQQAFDPFVMSNSFAPSTGVRMAHSQQQMMMQQQNGTYYQQQQQNMVPYQSPHQQIMVPYQSPQQQVQPVVFNLAQGNHAGGSVHVSGFPQPGVNMTQQGNHVGGSINVSGFSQPGMNMTQQHWNRGGGGNVSGFSQPGMNMAQQHWNHGGLI